MPYEDESEPIAKLVFYPTGTNGGLGEFAWVDLKPKFKQLLKDKGQDPDDVEGTRYNYRELNETFFIKILGEERDQLRKKENKLRLHKIYFLYDYDKYLPPKPSAPELNKIRNIRDSSYFISISYKN